MSGIVLERRTAFLCTNPECGAWRLLPKESAGIDPSRFFCHAISGKSCEMAHEISHKAIDVLQGRSPSPVEETWRKCHRCSKWRFDPDEAGSAGGRVSRWSCAQLRGIDCDVPQIVSDEAIRYLRTGKVPARAKRAAQPLETEEAAAESRILQMYSRYIDLYLQYALGENPKAPFDRQTRRDMIRGVEWTMKEEGARSPKDRISWIIAHTPKLLDAQRRVRGDKRDARELEAAPPPAPKAARRDAFSPGSLGPKKYWMELHRREQEAHDGAAAAGRADADARSVDVRHAQGKISLLVRRPPQYSTPV